MDLLPASSGPVYFLLSGTSPGLEQGDGQASVNPGSVLYRLCGFGQVNGPL